MCPLVKAFQEHSTDFQTQVCVTAQHRQMLDQVLELFELTPDYDLNIMQPNQTISMITANVLTGLEPVLQKEKPDVVLVHGDTSTTFVTISRSRWATWKRVFAPTTNIPRSRRR